MKIATSSISVRHRFGNSSLTTTRWPTGGVADVEDPLVQQEPLGQARALVTQLVVAVELGGEVGVAEVELADPPAVDESVGEAVDAEALADVVAPHQRAGGADVGLEDDLVGDRVEQVDLEVPRAEAARRRGELHRIGAAGRGHARDGRGDGLVEVLAGRRVERCSRSSSCSTRRRRSGVSVMFRVGEEGVQQRLRPRRLPGRRRCTSAARRPRRRR